MFIQIIQGRCSRPDELHALIDRWRDEEAPHATGWLGGTYGFTDANLFVGVVRFESREAAAANSERPAQTQWSERLTELMDGPVEYHDCEDVTLMMDGGSDDAGFVQLIRGRVDPSSADRLRSLMTDTDVLHEARPEIIGASLAIEDDGTFTETVAFTDEASARRGEQEAAPRMPSDVRERLDLALAGASFLDLHRPWFHSAPAT